MRASSGVSRRSSPTIRHTGAPTKIAFTTHCWNATSSNQAAGKGVSHATASKTLRMLVRQPSPARQRKRAASGQSASER
jgi:hypothetical protein